MKQNLLYITFLILTATLLSSYSMYNEIESDTTKFKEEKKYVDKLVEAYNKESFLSTDSVLYDLIKLKRLSAEIEYTKGLAETNFLIAKYYDLKSIGDSAILYYTNGLNYSRSLNYLNYLKRYAEYIAETYWETGNYFECINFTSSVIEQYIENNYTQRLFYLYDVLALAYRDIGDVNKALELFNRSYKNSTQHNELAFSSTTLTNIGKIYWQQQEYEKALEYYLKGVVGEEKYGHILYAGRSYVSIALIYLELKNEVKTEEFLNKALEYNTKTDDIIGFSRTYKAFGKLRAYQKRYNDALTCLNKSKTLALQGGKNLTLANIYKDLSDVYYVVNQPDSSYLYLKKYLNITEELFSFDKLSDLKRAEFDLKVEKNNSKLQQLELDKQKTKTRLILIIFTLLLIITLLFIVLYIQSIKSKRKLETINKKLKIAQLKAEESDKLKSHFLRNISHEIRTPLNGILGFSEMILDEDLPKSEREEINYLVQKNSNELMSTIENMVDTAHLETNQYQTNFTTFNVQELIDDTISLIKEMPEYHKKDIHIEKLTSLDPKIRCDKNILHKVLYQLIKNALFFTDTGKISIDFIQENSSVKFIIEDTGIGIPKDKLDIIFTSFQKADDINEKQRGNGLGLSIVSHFIHLLHGELGVNSAPGKGSRFYFTVPVE